MRRSGLVLFHYSLGERKLSVRELQLDQVKEEQVETGETRTVQIDDCLNVSLISSEYSSSFLHGLLIRLT